MTGPVRDRAKVVEVAAGKAGGLEAARFLIASLAQKIGEKELAAKLVEFCKDTCERGFDAACETLAAPGVKEVSAAGAVATAGVAGAVVAPWVGVLVCVALFCGPSLAAWRKNKKKDEALRGELARLASAVEEWEASGADAGALAVHFEKHGWVPARLDNVEKHEISGFVTRDVEALLDELGLAKHETLDYVRIVLDGVSAEVWTINKRTAVMATETALIPEMLTKLTELLARSEAEIREKIEPDIRRAVEAQFRDEFSQMLAEKDAQIARLTAGAARAAKSPGFLERLRETRDGKAIVDALGAAAKETGADFVAILRERAEWAYFIGETSTAEECLRAILTLLPNDLDALNRLGQAHALRGEYAQAIALFERVITHAGDDHWRAIAFANMAPVHLLLGTLDTAERCIWSSLEIFQHINREDAVATQLAHLGLIFLIREQFDEAEGFMRRSLDILERLNLPAELASQYANLALILQSKGQLDEAESLIRKSLSIDESIGRTPGQAKQLGNLGNLLLERGHVGEADALFRNALSLHERIGDDAGVSASLCNLGSVSLVRGDLAEAQRLYERSLAIEERSGRIETLALVCGNLGQVLVYRCEFAEAERQFSRSAMLAKTLGLRGLEQRAHEAILGARSFARQRARFEAMPDGDIAFHEQLGRTAQRHGNYLWAKFLHSKSRDVAERLGRDASIASANGNLGLIAFSKGDLGEAESLFNRSLETSKRIGDRPGIASALGNLGVVARHRGNLGDAERLLKSQLEIEEEIGRVEGRASAYCNLGIVEQMKGNLDEATRLQKLSLAISQQFGMKNEIAISLVNLAIVEQIRGNLDESENVQRRALQIKEELGDQVGMATIYFNLGTLDAHREQWQEARAWGIKARDLFRKIDRENMVKHVEEWLAELPEDGKAE